MVSVADVARRWWSAPAAVEAARYPVQPELLSPWQADPNQLKGIEWAGLFDVDVLPVSRTQAMKIPAVAKGRHVLCPKVAGYPLRLLSFDRITGTDTQLPTPYWIVRTDTDSPWHRMLWTADDLMFTGWSLWKVVRGTPSNGSPILDAARVDRGRWGWDKGKLIVDKTPVPLDQLRNYVAIPGPHEGILNYGNESIRRARKTLVAALDAAELGYLLELHQTGGDPLTGPEIDELIARWAKARRGSNGRVAYTNASIETKPGESTDSKLHIEGRNADAVDMARLIGIAAAMVDATVPKSSLTYETTQGRGLEHTEYGVEPYLEAIAARLSMDDVTPAGTRFRFDIGDDLTPQPSPTGPTVED